MPSLIATVLRFPTGLGNMVGQAALGWGSEGRVLDKIRDSIPGDDLIGPKSQI